MRIALFCHSLLSDWNHGNAHFLRGIVTDLVARGHEVQAYEARDAWSVVNMTRDYGEAPLEAVREVYPGLNVVRYDPAQLDLEAALHGRDLVLVHEWTPPWLVARIGRERARGGRFRLLFHDTHHRAVTAPDTLATEHLDAYDGVLAFGETIRQVYLERGWAHRVWTWHEAADVRVFRPFGGTEPPRGLVWIGNWGDDERTAELNEYLLQPSRALSLSTDVYGVRYPEAAQVELARAGLRYRGWLPNFRVPEVFARHRVTVHVPRRPYAERLPGIPTIRPFEALACGIPLVSAAWDDREGLFRPGIDYLIAHDGGEMRRHLRDLLHDDELSASLAESGLHRIRERHTCAHRVSQLLDICRQLGMQNASHDDSPRGSAAEVA